MTRRGQLCKEPGQQVRRPYLGGRMGDCSSFWNSLAQPFSLLRLRTCPSGLGLALQEETFPAPWPSSPFQALWSHDPLLSSEHLPGAAAIRSVDVPHSLRCSPSHGKRAPAGQASVLCSAEPASSGQHPPDTCEHIRCLSLLCSGTSRFAQKPLAKPLGSDRWIPPPYRLLP